MADAATPIRPDDPKSSPFTSDTLQNLVTGLGTTSAKHSATEFTVDRMSAPQLDAAYTSDWLAAKVVDIIPDEMVREWRTIDSGLKPAQVASLKASEERHDVSGKLGQALKWARLYGGSGVVMGIDGAGEFHEPLDLRRVRPGALQWLRVLDRQYLLPDRIEVANPLSPSFAEPSHYRALSGSDLIHRSRILFFHGHELPYRQKLAALYWGGSVLDRVQTAVINAGATQANIAELIHEAKIDVFKIPGLFDRLGDDAGTAILFERMQLLNQGKSVLNGILMDTTEVFEQKTEALSPVLDALLERFLSVVAAATGIPVTRLLGTSAKGLNATGDGDDRSFYDMIKRDQNRLLRPQLCKLDEVLLRSELQVDPAGVEWSFPSLWQLSEVDESTVSLNDAQRDVALYDAGAIEAHHIAARLQDAGIYPTLGDEYVEELKTEPEPEPDPAPAGGAPGFGSFA